MNAGKYPEVNNFPCKFNYGNIPEDLEFSESMINSHLSLSVEYTGVMLERRSIREEVSTELFNIMTNSTNNTIEDIPKDDDKLAEDGSSIAKRTRLRPEYTAAPAKIHHKTPAWLSVLDCVPGHARLRSPSRKQNNCFIDEVRELTSPHMHEILPSAHNRPAFRKMSSPGPSRFANAGRPARTGMIRRHFLTQSHYFPVPPRLKPVNSPAESRSIRTGYGLSRAPVKAGSCLGESRQRPGTAPVYRNTAGTHRVYTGIRPRQSYGNAPVLLRSSPIMPRRSPGECRWLSGRAPCRDSELGRL
ncbi:hypothetical protein DPMN_137813 [Dreissena polymorpha]|uniref:Uncharacterized protein n=1 Tax=Dreissena polymorpha TaxID=45954 RepID=A0A9D4G5F3_DREPO|nr:hypothetical protein DPMN_137813 [Dreissena polymorpha]